MPQEKVNEKTGEVTVNANLTFWGGTKFVRVGDLQSMKGVNAGDWLKIRCEVREFKDAMYAGAARVLEINGHPLGK